MSVLHCDMLQLHQLRSSDREEMKKHPRERQGKQG